MCETYTPICPSEKTLHICTIYALPCDWRVILSSPRPIPTSFQRLSVVRESAVAGRGRRTDGRGRGRAFYSRGVMREREVSPCPSGREAHERPTNRQTFRGPRTKEKRLCSNCSEISITACDGGWDGMGHPLGPVIRLLRTTFDMYRVPRIAIVGKWSECERRLSSVSCPALTDEQSWDL